MSFIETETVVSTSGLSEVDLNAGDAQFRQRKKARRTESLQLLSTETSDKMRPRKICRRHSFAFRCPEHETDEDADEGKHYESVLLVKVFSAQFKGC